MNPDFEESNQPKNSPNSGKEDISSEQPVAKLSIEKAGEGELNLPQKRGADEKPAGYYSKPNPRDEKGIEIGVRVIEEKESRQTGEPIQRLEVQEHVPKSARDEGILLPKLAPGQVIDKGESSVEEHQEIWGGRVPESENWGRSKQAPVRWIFVSILLLGIFLVAGALFIPRLKLKGTDSRRKVPNRIEAFDPYKMDMAKKAKSSLTDDFQDKAMMVVDRYAKAKTVEEVLSLVRDHGRLEGIIRKQWKPLGLPANWHIPGESKWEILRTGDLDYGRITGEYPDYTQFNFYIVQQGDDVLLDWAATTAYSETPFEALDQGQGKGGVVRAYVTPGNLYTFAFPEKEYQCFRLSPAGEEDAIWGYVKHGDLLDEVIKPFVGGAITKDVTAECKMTLKLEQAPADALKNQWIISEMLSLDWITP